MKVDRQSALRMSIGSEFQMLGATTLNVCLAVSVRVVGTKGEEHQWTIGTASSLDTATVRRGTAGRR